MAKARDPAVGFHGISHQCCAARATEILSRDLKQLRLIACHLGNSCWLAAIRAGRSVDTTMGFTPLEGCLVVPTTFFSS